MDICLGARSHPYVQAYPSRAGRIGVLPQSTRYGGEAREGARCALHGVYRGRRRTRGGLDDVRDGRPRYSSGSRHSMKTLGESKARLLQNMQTPEWCHRDESIRRLPFVVLTRCREERERRSYRHGKPWANWTQETMAWKRCGIGRTRSDDPDSDRAIRPPLQRLGLKYRPEWATCAAAPAAARTPCSISIGTPAGTLVHAALRSTSRVAMTSHSESKSTTILSSPGNMLPASRRLVSELSVYCTRAFSSMRTPS